MKLIEFIGLNEIKPGKVNRSLPATAGPDSG